MLKNSYPSFIQRIASVAVFILIVSVAFAQSGKDSLEQKKGTVIIDKQKQQGFLEENLTSLERDARAYRDQGVALQNSGNIDGAMVLYQKAIELDPKYAVPYNDLGIIFEAKGFTDRAEDAYLRASKIDPNYLSSYTNLALLYENNRDLNKAVQYWQKRAELGAIDDPWTIKARQRLDDIQSVLAKSPSKDAREQEVAGFLREVAVKKELLKKDDSALAKDYFEKAKRYYDLGDLVTARKIALDAQQLDPNNEEIQGFVDRIQRRVLSK